jgi:hypothetical protein
LREGMALLLPPLLAEEGWGGVKLLICDIRQSTPSQPPPASRGRGKHQPRSTGFP